MAERNGLQGASNSRATPIIFVTAESFAHSPLVKLKSGRLVQLLPDYELPEASIQALPWPGRRIPPQVRAFIDFLAGPLSEIE